MFGFPHLERRGKFPSPASIAAVHLRWRKLNLDEVSTPRKETFGLIGCQQSRYSELQWAGPWSTSCIGRRPRLRRPCLPAVNRFHCAQNIWLDKLLVALALKLLLFWESGGKRYDSPSVYTALPFLCVTCTVLRCGYLEKENEGREEEKKKKRGGEQGRLAHKGQMGQAHPKNFR